MKHIIVEDQYILDTPNRIVPPYSWVAHIPFAFYLVNALKPRLFVELGVHTGNSYNAFCQMVERLRTNTKCYGIDTWMGDKQAGFYDDSIYKDLYNYQQKEYSNFSKLLRMTFDDGLSYFSDKSIDLLHIDGLHTYEAVKHDFESWLPKMSDKGVIIFHDTCVKKADFGVWKLWEEISKVYPSFYFKHSHGLGVLAVGDNVDKDFIDFIKRANDDNFYIYLFERLGRGYFDNIEFQSEIDRLNNEVVNLTSQLKIATSQISKIYIDTSSGYNENETLIKEIDTTSKTFSITFELSNFPTIKSLRWDPVENRFCNIKMNSILYGDESSKEYSLDINQIQSNGIVQSDKTFVFKTFYPTFLFPISGKLSYLTIQGEWTFFNNLQVEEEFRKNKNSFAFRKNAKKR